MLKETKDAILGAIQAECKKIADADDYDNTATEAAAVHALTEAWCRLPDEVPEWKEHVQALRDHCNLQPVCSSECPMYDWCDKYFSDELGAKAPGEWEV